MGSQVSVTPKGSQPATNPLLSFMPMVGVLAILYFLVIRPQQKQAANHRKMVDELKSSDKVLTQGGIYGTVVGFKGDVVQVRIANNVIVDVARTSITQVNPEAVAPTPTPTPVASVS